MSNLIVVEEVATTVVVPELASMVSVIEDVGTTVVVQETSAADIVEVVAVGPQGASGTLAIGSVTTGAPGSSASITNVGTSTDAVLNVVIPRGDTGTLTPELVQAKVDAQAAAAASQASSVASAGSASSSNTSAVLAAGSASNAATQATAAANSAASIVGAEASTTAKAAEALTNANNAAASASTATTKASEASTSATNAAGSATAAASSAAAASTSATSAAGSATTATTKAAEALTQANNAQSSADDSADSAVDAAASASAANSSASLAITKAAEATTAATNAASGSLAATSKATEAANSATSAATSATAASNSASSASTSASTATGKATEAQTSATNAAASAATATTRATEASTSATNAATSATGAGTSATSAAGSASAASTSATSASTSAGTATTQAGIATTKAGEAATSATNAANSATTATTKASEAATSASSASGSASTATTKAAEALTSASNAATSASQAATSATNAATSATAADTSKTAAATSATNAATSATSASGSATTATTKAGEATTSASSASTFATTATTKATEAGNSATAAAGSATSAAGSATTATTQAGNASSSATAAQTAAATATTKAAEAVTSATNAATSATTASNQATAASGSATSAAGSATTATTQATTATTKAGEASTSATNAAASATTATTKASEAASSASAAAAAKAAAETARDQTLSAFDSFDDRYLGQKASDPTVDNDGNALIAGAIYFNTGAIGSGGGMKVYDGTAWLVAYASLAGTLLKANNLSDLNNTATARTNLGLGNVENKSSATIRGELTSGNVTTALGFTPYDATNPSSYITTAGARSAISVTGAGSYDSSTGVINIVGGVTSFNTRTGAISLVSGDVTGALGFTPYNATNPSGYITSSALSSYLPLAGGTLTGALTINATTSTPLTINRTTNANSNMLFSSSSYSTYFGLGSANGELRVGLSAGLQTSGNIILHAGNYTSYSPSLSVAHIAARGTFTSGNWDTMSSHGTYKVQHANFTNDTNAPPASYAYGICEVTVSEFGGEDRIQQIYWPHAGDNFFYQRMRNGGVWTSWYKVYRSFSSTALDASNYNSYAPTLTGTGASGTWGISITGTAATATSAPNYLPLSGGTLSGALILHSAGGTNGFYTGTGDGASFSTYNFLLRGWSGMAFENPTSGGTYPNQVSGVVDFREGFINMKGGFRVNGSAVLHAGNYNSYALPLSGGTLTGSLYWPATAGVGNGNSRSLLTGFSGGNYGQTGYGISYTTTSGLHNYAINDIVSMWEAYDGLRVYAAAAGTVGTAITWTTVLDARRSNTALVFKGQTVLDGGNYTNYAFKAEGTINGDIDADRGQGVVTFDPVPTGTPPLSSPNIRTLNIGNSFSRRTQLAFDYATDRAWFRRRDSGWNTWREFLHTGNYSSYALPLSGGTLTGILNISNGDSSYVTFGPNTTYSGSLRVGTGVGPFGLVSGRATIYSDNGNLKIDAGTGQTLYLNQHNGGGTVYIGGTTNYILHTGNYNSFAPTLTGGGASGSWGISVTGSAGSIAWSGVTGKPTTVAGYGITDIASSHTHSYLPLAGGTLTGSLTIGSDGGGANIIQRAVSGWGDVVQVMRGGSLAWALQDSSGSAKVTSSNFYVGTNLALHAGNYNSYSPTLTGGGASGTWGINVTGSADNANYSIYSRILDTRAGQYSPNDYTDYRTTYEFTNQIVGSDWHTAMTMQGWNNGYSAWQIIGPASTSAHENWYLRSGINTSWNSVKSILHSGNYTSYSPSLTGSGASGTWGINVTGNANSASTLNSGATINGNAYFRKNQTAGDYGTAALWTESYGNTTTGIAFHISGVVGKFLEMRTNGTLYWNSDTVFHSGNYSSYALPLSGGTMTGSLSFAQNANINFGSSTNEAGPWTISVIGSGGATPATKGTGYGRNLIIKAGNSDNGGGLAGGDLYLRAGAPTAPATSYGVVYLSDDGGYTQAGGSLRAPIFYDSNNTGYYVDPAGGSQLNQVSLGSGSKLHLVGLADGNHYLRYVSGGFSGVTIDGPQLGGHQGGELITNYGGDNWSMRWDYSGHTHARDSSRAQIFYDRNNTNYYIDPANGGFNLLSGAATLTTNTSGFKVTNAEGNGVADVRLGAAWGAPGIYSSSSIYLMSEASVYFKIANADKGYMDSSSNLFAFGSMRSPIFYDSNDTARYVDPNGESRLSTLRLSGARLIINGGDPTIQFVDGDQRGAALHNNSNLFYILSSNGVGGESWTTNNGYWPFYVDLNSNDSTFGGSIWAAGNITAYSDIKLKENIQTIDGALEKVLKLRGVYYTLKRDESQTRKVGVIAQEIQEVLPEVVVLHKDIEDTEGTLSVDYGNISGLLIEAVKDQNQEVLELRKRVAKLESLISKLIEG